MSTMVRRFLPVVLLSILSLSCGSGNGSPGGGNQQPGNVPTPAPTSEPSPEPGRNWSQVTLAESPCPPPLPSEPTCLAAITLWSVDDEGKVSAEGPSRESISDEDLVSLDARVDAVKNSEEFNCTQGQQTGYNQAVSIRFEDGEELQYYTRNTGTDQECHRGSLERNRELFSEMRRIKDKYSCVCLDPGCSGCAE